MIKSLLKGVLSGIAVKLLANYQRLSMQLLKIEATKSYLHGVQMARALALGMLRMGLVAGLIGVGVVLFHVGLFILLPGTVKAKALLGMFLGIVYVVIGWFALRAALDEKTWLEKSGAADMLKAVADKSQE